jgi:hypothetical protein
MQNKEILRQLADNIALLAAVKYVIESKFALDGINTQMNNESIGQVVRANIDGRARVDEAFKEILTYRSVPKGGDKLNPGR